MNLRRFTLLYLGYVFLFDAMLAYAVYTAVFELEGLSPAAIGTLLAIWSASAILLELPSGALSDRFDRRWLLIAAPLVKALAFVAWAVAGGEFWIYAAGFVAWSIGQALFTGSKEALLYETLEADGHASDYERFLGRDRAATYAGIGAGTVLGGFVGAFDLTLTFWLSVPPLLLAAGLALALREARTRRHAATDDPFGHFRDAVAEFRTRPVVRNLAVYLAAGAIILEVLEEFDQLYYLAVSLPIWAFGVVGVAILAASGLASLYAWRFSGIRWLFWAAPLASGLCLVAAGQAGSLWMLLPLVLAYIVSAPAHTLAEARFQSEMGGDSRATTTSALVVLMNITGIALTQWFGALSDWLGILPAYAWAGAYLIGFGLWVLASGRAKALAAAGDHSGDQAS